jgi:peroxiredoxin
MRYSRIFMLLFLGFFLPGCNSQADSSRATSNSPIKAPDFEILDLEGNKVSLKGLAGTVVLLDFWATWCPPCVMSTPRVVDFYNQNKDKKVQVLSVSLDSSDGPVRTFVERHQMKNVVALAGSSGMDMAYGVQGIPAFFLIDQKGFVVKAWQGFHPMMPRQWQEEVDHLLARRE